MSQASKRRKLSLKKTASQNTTKSVESGNTIISMFKRQTDKQTKVESELVTESGSEGDVVITNVIGLNTDLQQSASNSTSDSRSVDNRNNPKQVKGIAKKLSLSERKRSKVKEKNEIESASDSEFDSASHSRGKRISKYCKLSRTLSETDAREHESPYKLRKRNTVPIVEVSDDEIDTEEKTDELVIERNEKVASSGLESSKGHEDVTCVEKQNAENTADDDVVIDITKSEGKSKYFSNTSKRKLSPGKRGLSLKKPKSGGENLNESVKVQEKKSINHLPSDQEVTNDKEQKTDGRITDTQEVERTKVAETSNAEKDSNVHKSEKIIVNNVNSVLMKRSSSSKEMNELEAKTRNNDEKSKLGDKSKGKRKGLVSGRTLTKNNSKNQNIPTNSKQETSDADTAEGNVNNNEDSDNADGDNDNDEAERGSEDTEFRVPYYLENFRTIMTSVLDDKENARLFNDTDMKYIETFNELEEPSQKLYVRLFSRKLSWLPTSKVNYPGISNTIPELIDTLVNAGLLHSGADLSDLSIVLKILSAPDLKGLAKSFHINSQGRTKPRIVEELMKKSQQSSISSMFKGGATGTMEKTILNRAKSYLGKVCRLQDEPRAVFIRILMLFSLYNTNFDEESGGGGQNQLFQMLMVNVGRVVYPTYTVNRNMSVFQDRAALVRFETALQFEMDIQGMTERGKWAQAYDIYKQAKEAGKPVLKDKKYMKWDRRLPQFLRLYTAGSVYTRIDNQGVEILQRLKLYKDAVYLLEELLGQDLYCIQYRGHWYERLALNLEAHLKSVEKSLSVIKRGLLDPTVRTGRRLALFERARKICEAPKSKHADRISEFEHQEVLPTPEVYIEGMVISDATSVGMKYQFVMQGDSDSVTFCAVEELVLEHYKQNGYPEGLHAEGSIVSNLFVLLFWDIMFMDVENVFHGPFQSCPLDIATQDFYLNRQQHVDDRLDWLKNASVEELITEVGRIWSDHEGEMCAGMNWEKFSGPETHQNLISCMEGPVVAGLLERYVKDPRHTRSGFPDLTLWNTDAKQFKICEVKGPNDRLSYKQILWIDYLQKMGVDAEVCYVKAVGSKKLKPVVKN